MSIQMPEPPSLVEYRLAQVEKSVERLVEVVTDFRMELATKTEVQALREEMDRRLKPLEEDRIAHRPWVAPTAALGAIAAVVTAAWQAAHGA